MSPTAAQPAMPPTSRQREQDGGDPGGAGHGEAVRAVGRDGAVAMDPTPGCGTAGAGAPQPGGSSVTVPAGRLPPLSEPTAAWRRVRSLRTGLGIGCLTWGSSGTRLRPPSHPGRRSTRHGPSTSREDRAECVGSTAVRRLRSAGPLAADGPGPGRSPVRAGLRPAPARRRTTGSGRGPAGCRPRRSPPPRGPGRPRPWPAPGCPAAGDGASTTTSSSSPWPCWPATSCSRRRSCTSPR